MHKVYDLGHWDIALDRVRESFMGTLIKDLFVLIKCCGWQENISQGYKNDLALLSK